MFLIELFQNMENVLYHGTHLTSANDIIIDNRIAASANGETIDISNPKLPFVSNTTKNKNIVSLTRDYGFAKKFSNDNVVFSLDAKKLRQKYKIIPFDFFSYFDKPSDGDYKYRRREKEEACFGDIFPLDKYLKAIYLRYPKYRYCMNSVEDEGEKSPYYQLINHPLLKITGGRILSNKNDKLSAYKENPDLLR